MSLPAAQAKTAVGTGGFAYPAYGETAQPTTFASDRLTTATKK